MNDLAINEWKSSRLIESLHVEITLVFSLSVVQRPYGESS